MPPIHLTERAKIRHKKVDFYEKSSFFELYSNRMELLKSKNFNAKIICVPNSSLPNILRL